MIFSHLQVFWYLRISNWVVCSLKNESFTVTLVLMLLISLFSLRFSRNSIQAELGFSWEESQDLLAELYHRCTAINKHVSRAYSTSKTGWSTPACSLAPLHGSEDEGSEELALTSWKAAWSLQTLWLILSQGLLPQRLISVFPQTRLQSVPRGAHIFSY